MPQEQNSISQERKSIMARIRKKMRAELRHVLVALNLEKQWERVAFSLPQKKFKNVSIRGPLSYMIYEYVKEEAKSKNIPLAKVSNRRLFDTHIPFILEIVISIQYLENQILDGKGGLLKRRQLDRQKTNFNLLSSHFLKDFIYQYVYEMICPNAGRERDAILKNLRQMFQFVDEGQFAEKKWSSFINYNYGFIKKPCFSPELEASINMEVIDDLWIRINASGIDSSKEPFVRFYLCRIYMTNAIYFSMIADMIMNLLEYPAENRHELRKFTQMFGMLQQLINDINDYLPISFGQTTITKKVDDAFSDLKNGNLTLPFFYYAKDKKINYKALVQYLDHPQKQKEIFNDIKPSVYYILIPLLVHYAKDTQKCLNNEMKAFKALGDAPNIVFSRKYFKYFKTKGQYNPFL